MKPRPSRAASKPLNVFVVIVGLVSVLFVLPLVGFSLLGLPSVRAADPTPTAPPALRNQQQIKLYLPIITRQTVSSRGTDHPAPIVVQRSPAPGEELAPDEGIELVFDRPMRRDSVETAFTLTAISTAEDTSPPPEAPAPSPTPILSVVSEPVLQAEDQPIGGQFVWGEDDQTLHFTPTHPLSRSTRYEVRIGGTALAADGTPIGSENDYRARFVTAGHLEVGAVIPADGTDDIDPKTSVTVTFNRPVVPLAVVEQQDNFPSPLRFEPALEGTGEWLNTSIYIFHPASPLQTDTTYTVSIREGLTDAVGNPMQQPYSWSFTTALPPLLEVSGTWPRDHINARFPLETRVRVHFTQEVDPASARAHFRLREQGGSAVDGTATVASHTLLFTPSQYLDLDTTYQIEVDAGVESAEGGRPLHADFRETFATVPLPKVVSTEPADGSTEVRAGRGVRISFSAPIDPDTVMPVIVSTPPFSPTEVYTSYSSSSYNSDFYLGLDTLPSTDYEIRIGPGIADPYGNTTSQTTTVHFRTAPRAPRASFVVPRHLALYSAYEPARVRLSAVNVSAATLALYRMPPEKLVGREYYSYPFDDIPPGDPDITLIRQWDVAISPTLNEETNTLVDLVEGGGTLEPGAYLLTLDTPETDPDSHVLVVSTANLTLKKGYREALVWATDLQSGEPVANMGVDFYDRYGHIIGHATTDSDGVARTSITESYNIHSYAFAVAREPFAAASSHWGTVSPYDFGLPTASVLSTRKIYVYTDRPIYRPGHVVHFKGVVRDENDARYSLPTGFDTVRVRIKANYEEAHIYDEQLPLGPNGTFNGSLELPADASPGTYRMFINAGSYDSSDASFRVASYRPPEFGVDIETQADEVVRGAPIQATVAVSYFFGLPVQDASVKWEAWITPYHFSLDGFGYYDFGSSDYGFWRCWECWWYEPVRTALDSGSGTTDENGRLPIALPPESFVDEDGNPIEQSVRLTIQAVATGPDNQAISSQRDIIIHGSEIYVGLASQNRFGQAGDPQQINLVTTNTSGRPAANQEVEVDVYRYTWHSTYLEDEKRWEWEEEKTSVYTETLTTDEQGQASFSFTPAEGGSYRVNAHTRDTSGRAARSTLSLWVASNGYISWRRDNNSHITMVADKNSYHVGEIAEIFIPSPFQGTHHALITVERGGILSHEVLTVEGGNSLVYHLPLTADYAPNVYVSAVLFNPTTTMTTTDNPSRTVTIPPDYKVGIVPLEVLPEPQKLTLTLQPDPAQSRPGDKVRYTVHVTDQEGNPVSAELSLDLVDKAVLSLAPRIPNAILEAFYGKRGLGILTANSVSVYAPRLQPEDEEEDHENGDDEAQPPTAPEPAPTTTPGKRPEEGEDEEESAEDKQGDQYGTRSNFADTAYWNATVETDAEGNATVTVDLPDNLTTWVMRAVGLTAETKVGEGEVELVSTRPLLIRPVTPRFFVVGDQAELAANISNSTNEPLAGQVWLTTTHGLSITSQLTHTVEVSPGGETQVTWDVLVGDADVADLVFSVEAGNYYDSSRPRLASGPGGTLPIYHYSAPETVGTGGQLAQEGARTEVIALPPNQELDSSQGEITVRLDPSLAAAMLDSLTYLEHYPYECVEQTVSRFLPNVMTARALKALGVEDPGLEARLPNLVNKGLNKLYQYQRSDGGWLWFHTDRNTPSTPSLSAYAVLGMVRAQEAGFEVRQQTLTEAINYLKSTLALLDGSTTFWQANQQAWLLYVLAEANHPDTSAMSSLYERRDRMGHYGRAFLAMALHRADPNDPRISTLLADLRSAALLSATGAHWEEHSSGYWSMNTDTRSTAIILSALARLDPTSDLNPQVVRWLMVARQGDRWETTQETAWAVMALTDWMAHSGELHPDYDYAVWLDKAGSEESSDPWQQGHMGADDLKAPVVLRKPIGDLWPDGIWLTIGRSAGSGKLYYTTHMRAFLPVEHITPLDRGIIVQRRYTLASCTEGPTCPEITQARIGDTIRVEVSVVVPASRFYLVVEDPLPAGAEIIDSSLATTESSDAYPPYRGDFPWYWWWWRWYDRSEFHDNRVVLFARHLGPGSYTYKYTMRATLPGTYHVIPTTANELYFPEVYGRGKGQIFRITR